jgi:hypothetical protein
MSNTHSASATQSPPKPVISGKQISCTREPGRAWWAALWVAGKAEVQSPTVAQAALVFGVTPAAVKQARDRVGTPRRHHHRHAAPTVTAAPDLHMCPAGTLTADQLLELAAAKEASAVKVNGSLHTS